MNKPIGRILTVNFDCETVRDPSKSMELKIMRQQSVLHSVARRRNLLTFMPQTTDFTMLFLGMLSFTALIDIIYLKQIFVMVM